MRLFHPNKVHALERLDGINRVLQQPGKQKQRAIAPANLRIRHRVKAAQLQPGNLVAQQPVNRIAQRLLHLARAQNAISQKCNKRVLT